MSSEGQGPGGGRRDGDGDGDGGAGRMSTKGKASPGNGGTAPPLLPPPKTKGGGAAAARNGKARAKARASSKAKAEARNRTEAGGAGGPPPRPNPKLPELAAAPPPQPLPERGGAFQSLYPTGGAFPELAAAPPPQPPSSEGAVSSWSRGTPGGGGGAGPRGDPPGPDPFPGAVAVAGIGVVGDDEVEVVADGGTAGPGESDRTVAATTTATTATETETETGADEDEESAFVVPSAYAVGNIVEAQSVAPEHQLVHPDELAAAQSSSLGPTEDGSESAKAAERRRRRTALASAFVGGAAALAVALGVLGGTGRLGGGGEGGPEGAAPEEGEEPPPPLPDLRTRCDDDGVNCWVQLGPDVLGRDEGDEFARRVSLAGAGAAAPRVAVSAPEGRDGPRGIDAGNVWVYDLSVDVLPGGADAGAGGVNGTENGTAVAANDDVFDAQGPNVSWAQVGQRLSGSPGDEARGYLSPDGRTLALGAPLNDGPDGTMGSAGSVRVFRRDADSGNWTSLGGPIYGGEALERAGGTVALSQDGTAVALSVGRNAAGVGAVRVYRFSDQADGEEGGGSWAQVGEDLTGGDGDGDGDGADVADDGFGAAVSLSADGTAVAVGTPRGGGAGRCAGYARVYRLLNADSGGAGGRWTRVGGDIAGEEGDLLGSAGALSLSADGTAVAVGAPGGGGDDDADGEGGAGCDPGRRGRGRIDVHSYDADTDAWLTMGGPILGDSPGDALSKVSLSDDGRILAAGAALSDWAEDAGYVRVYMYHGGGSRSGGAWRQLGGTILGHARGERLGTSVALSGDGRRLAAGGWTDEELLRRGVVRLYGLPWLRDGPDTVGPDPGDRFGDRVSLDAAGTRLAVSAPKRVVAASAGTEGEEEAAAASSGAVQVYDIGDDGSLVPVGQELHGQPGDDIDGYLSGDGRRLAIAAKFNNGPNGTLPGTGKVTVFELRPAEPKDGESNETTEETWTLLGRPMYGEATKDKFGKYVAISNDGSVVAVGASSAAGRGQVRVFQYSDSTKNWAQLGPTLEGEAADDEFGWSVALSSDGAILAAGARHATGADGAYRSGHVRVFKYVPDSGNFTRLGDDIDGERDGDHLGKVVSLSSDGTVLAVTSSGSDDNGLDSGKVRVLGYREEEDAWRSLGGGDIRGDGESHELMRAALSADGGRVVTASHSADGYRGYVNVHDDVGGVWRRVGGRIWGHTGENFGWGIAVSNDGTRLAVGGPARKAESPMKGIVRLYKLPPM